MTAAARACVAPRVALVPPAPAEREDDVTPAETLRRFAEAEGIPGKRLDAALALFVIRIAEEPRAGARSRSRRSTIARALDILSRATRLLQAMRAEAEGKP